MKVLIFLWSAPSNGEESTQRILNGTYRWVALWSLTGNQGDTWREVAVPIPAEAVGLRFLGTTAAGFSSAMALDGIAPAGSFQDLSCALAVASDVASLLSQDQDPCGWAQAFSSHNGDYGALMGLAELYPGQFSGDYAILQARAFLC